MFQNDILSEAGTRLVMPVVASSDAPPDHPRLQPKVMVGDDVWVALALNVATLGLAEFGPPIADAKHARDDVTRALDMILSGV